MSAVLVAYAVTADGYPVHKAELNDGGVWITNQSMGAVGRENVPVAQIDAHIFSSGVISEDAGLDVLQDDAAVVSLDRDAQQLTPIDVSLARGLDEQVVTAGGDTTLFGGGSIASLDDQSGKLWATTYDPAVGIGDLSGLGSEAKPLATVGAKPVGTTATNGTVYAASPADGGTLVALRPVVDGNGFAKPEKSTLADSSGSFVAMTAVGDAPYVLDSKGALLDGGDELASIDEPAPVLQQAGPASDELLVATGQSLLAVALDGGKVRTLAKASGEAAAPVRVAGGCAFAAWHEGETGTIVSACGSGNAQAGQFTVKPDAELVFRVNRNQVILNDVVNGTAWMIEGATAEKISNWEAFQPRKEQKNDKDDRETEAETTTPPQAENDKLGGRPGRTTVLNVLDNDKVSDGKILSIVDVKQPTRDGVEVRIAPDRQTLLATARPTTSGRYSFTYTIDDGTKGKNAQDDGEVALDIRDDPGSAKPALRPHPPKRTYAIAAGAVLEVAVHPDWRDNTYGDPISVTGVKGAGDLQASTTAAGLVRLEAPPRVKGGPRTIHYTVATGEQSTAEGTLQVRVLAAGVDTVAPVAEPDVASGEVGAPIKIKPLDNDVPGADAADPGARLLIAGKVAPTGGLTVHTDLESRLVTVTGERPGTYLLDYATGFGAARRSSSEIRVDIAPATKDSDRPVATPDTASVHGMSPMVVDVLANDYDPKGRMLVVQNARPSTSNSQLEVAVLDGRWIRVNATDPSIVPQSQSVTYTVSNGLNSAEGSISVTQRPALTGAENAPITQVDRVTVRAGDTAMVPVLDNDSTPSGDPVGLVLDPTVAATGELHVLPSTGHAYVAGRQVRFVAPEDLTGAADVDVQYVVENTGDPTAPTAIGTVKVHITAPPSKTNPNQAPTPRALEGRVVQGDVVTLKLPPTGSDPDGDSVAVSGVSAPPRFGRVIAWGANSLTYQAYPDSTGTDEFSYLVSDRFGATATGDIRVGVVAPGAPQDPLAVDDALLAAPGRTVDVDVLANDMRTPGTKLTVEPLTGAPQGVKLRSETGPITVVAPDNGRTTRVVYTITNGLAESRGVVTVKGRDDFNNPPVVNDIFATPKPDASSITVDVLGKAYDVDGPEDDLKIDDVTGDDLDPGETGEFGAGGGDAESDAGAQKVEIRGGKVVVPITDVAQVLAYRVLDDQGAAAAAAIYVPARPHDTPYLKPGAEITLDPDSSTTADLEDLVVDPEGDPVRMTTSDTLVASPTERLSVTAKDTDTLEVEAADSVGPGAVMFEVTDGQGLDDRSAHHAFISVPVQVGDPEPVVSCPDEPIPVAEGSISRTVDVASVCHVWTADPADARDLEFTADWVKDQAVDGVDVTSVDGGGIRLAAGKEASRGDRGALAVAVKGHEPTGRLQVEVVELPSPTLAPISLDTEADHPVTVDVASYLTSPIPADNRDITIVDVTAGQGATATATHQGSKLTLTPRKDTSGVMRYQVEVSDVGGSGTKRPTVVGEVRLAVVARPDAPTSVTTGKELLSNTVALTWTAPDNNGERIDRYEVSYGGGSFTCPGSPCRVTGLDNGKPYTFKVKAHNAVGWSDWSNGTKGEADDFTGPVQNPQVLLARDGKLRVGWDAPASCDCSAVEKYRISAPGIGNVLVGPETRAYDVRATNGEETTVTIVPLNKKGLQENAGPTNSVRGVAAGAPARPAAPRLTPKFEAGNSQTTVGVSWAPVGANGPGPVSYEVRRDGAVVCTWRTETSCTDAGLANNGAIHTYTVRAKNTEADSDREKAAGGQAQHISPESAGAQQEASAPPSQPVITRLDPTGRDETANFSFTAGPSHGKSLTVTCNPGCGSWSFTPSGGSKTNIVIGNFPDGVPTNVTLTACNGSRVEANRCATSDPRSVTTYGDIAQPTLTTWVDSTYADVYGSWRARIDLNGKAAYWKMERRNSAYTEWKPVGGPEKIAAGTTTLEGRTKLSENSTYYYRLTIWDPDRNTVRAEAKSTTPDVPGPTVTSDQGDGDATSGWKVLVKGESFRKPANCRIWLGKYDDPDRTPYGDPWSQYNDLKWSGERLKRGVEHHIRCDNGAVSRNYTYFIDRG